MFKNKWATENFSDVPVSVMSFSLGKMEQLEIQLGSFWWWMDRLQRVLLLAVTGVFLEWMKGWFSCLALHVTVISVLPNIWCVSNCKARLQQLHDECKLLLTETKVTPKKRIIAGFFHCLLLDCTIRGSHLSETKHFRDTDQNIPVKHFHHKLLKIFTNAFKFFVIKTFHRNMEILLRFRLLLCDRVEVLISIREIKAHHETAPWQLFIWLTGKPAFKFLCYLSWSGMSNCSPIWLSYFTSFPWLSRDFPSISFLLFACLFLSGSILRVLSAGYLAGRCTLQQLAEGLGKCWSGK